LKSGGEVPMMYGMRRFGVSALAIAVVLAALVLPAAGSARANATLVVRLVSITTSTRVDDRPPRGPTAGDRIFSRSRLRNAVPQFGRARNAVVGSDRGTLTFTSASAVRLDVTATLPGGTLRVRGPQRMLRDGGRRYPVVGGTGRFAGARGTVTVRPLSGTGSRASNVYRLTLP
jgi:hypothetical protein